MARNFNRSVIENSRRAYQKQIRESQLECDHKDSHGPMLEPVRTTSMYVQDKHRYSDQTVICKQCKDIFEMQAYTQEEIRKALFTIKSMANQIKVLDDCSDEDYEKVKDICSIADELESSFVPYYNGMIKRLSKGREKQKGQTRQKGKLGGLSSNQFATR